MKNKFGNHAVALVFLTVCRAGSWLRAARIPDKRVARELSHCGVIRAEGGWRRGASGSRLTCWYLTGTCLWLAVLALATIIAVGLSYLQYSFGWSLWDRESLGFGVDLEHCAHPRGSRPNLRLPPTRRLASSPGFLPRSQCKSTCPNGARLVQFDLPSLESLFAATGGIILPDSTRRSHTSGLLGASAGCSSGWPLDLELDSLMDGADVIASSKRPVNSSEANNLARRFGRLHFFVVTTNLAKASRHVLRSAAYSHPVVSSGHRWTVIDAKSSQVSSMGRAYDCLQQATWAGPDEADCQGEEPSSDDVLVFLHDDVHLLPNFELSIYQQLARLADEDPGWCAVAMAGATQYGGMVGRFFDWGMVPIEVPHTAATLLEARVIPDEAMLVLRRGGAAQFDPALPGFHCYGAVLGLGCIAAGRSVHLIDGLSVSHKSWSKDGSVFRVNGDLEEWEDGLDWNELNTAATRIRNEWQERVNFTGLRTTACPLDSGKHA